jgi:hypothetical protein
MQKNVNVSEKDANMPDLEETKGRTGHQFGTINGIDIAGCIVLSAKNTQHSAACEWKNVNIPE